MFVDPLRDGYSMTELTEAINIVPNRYGRVTQLGLFRTKGVSQPTFTIEQKEGTLRLIKTAAWGTTPIKSQVKGRTTKAFAIPHTPTEDHVSAAEIMGVRKFGSENELENANDRVLEKLEVMRGNLEQTMDWRQMSALKGIVLDADGTTVLENYFTAFGVTPPVINFQLSTATTDVRKKVLDLKRHIEDNLLGERMTSVHALVSADFFDALTKHANVEKAYANYQEAKQRLGGDNRIGFEFCGVMFEEYRAYVDGQRFIASGEAHAFPLGTTNLFSNYCAPADFMETVNTIGLEYYARQRNTDFNRGVDLHAQANQMPFVNRPALVPKLLAA